jgi:Tol biopolymer transport system component
MGLVAMGCSSYMEDIGGGFVVRTRVRHGMSHVYKERDLYYKGIVGIRRLIHKDIGSAEVSSDGKKILFFARRQRPEPVGMDHILCVFERENGGLTRVEEGEFYYRRDYWSPDSDKLVNLRNNEPIMLFELSTGKPREITGKGYYFLGWSPSGDNVAFATDKSIYDLNSLYYANIEEPTPILVSEKKGLFRKEDFEWVTVDGDDKIIVKESES